MERKNLLKSRVPNPKYPKLIIPVGIPGSGKSTWAKSLFPWYYGQTVAIHSSDDIREELTGDATTQTSNNEVFETFHHRIHYDLDLWQSGVVFADATNLTRDARKKLIAIADMRNAEKHLVIFGNLTQAVKRNQERERVVPDHVMQKMLDKYEYFRVQLIQELDWYDSVTDIKSFS